MSDFNAPTLSSLYTDFLNELKLRDVSAVTLCLADPTNTPTGSIKWNRTGSKFQEWNGSAWVDQVVSLAGGGTGVTSAIGIRGLLGLGTMSLQNSNAVAIDGGTIGGAVNIDASRLTSGIVNVNRLGTGAGAYGGGYRVLYDNNSWFYPINVGVVVMFAGNTPPSGYLWCDGGALPRAGTFADLFSVIGTTFGAGDGSTTFNVPNFNARFPWGAGYNGVSGHNIALGQVADTWYHGHNVGAHAHGISGVYPHAHTASTSVFISDPGHSHTYYTFFDAAIGSDWPNLGTAGAYGAQTTSHVGTGIGASASTTVNAAGGTTATDAAGATTDGVSHLPPYLGIRFMIRAV